MLKTSSTCFNALKARSAFGFSHQFKDPGAIANDFTGRKCVGEVSLHFHMELNELGVSSVPTGKN